MVCARCEQDYLRTFTVAKTGDSGLVCDECDALWLAGVDLPYPGWADRSTYMQERGLSRDDLTVGSKTGEEPPFSNVRVRRMLHDRAHKPAPDEPAWGEIGGIRCPYCNGHLLDAEIPSGVRFSFCLNCEALWPDGVALTPTWPTCLADFLDDHQATWDDVTNLGRRREA